MDEQGAAVEAYVAAQSPAAQEFLTTVRGRVAELVPDAGEKIGYQILGFTVGGRFFLYAAGWARHVSCYPVPSSDPELLADLEPYVAGKGTVKFMLHKPIPWDLVDRVITVAARDRR